MLRNAAENDLKASQKTNEDISKRIEELQKQVQTEKVNKTNFRFASNYQMKVQRKINISSLKFCTVESECITLEFYAAATYMPCALPPGQLHVQKRKYCTRSFTMMYTRDK